MRHSLHFTTYHYTSLHFTTKYFKLLLQTSSYFKLHKFITIPLLNIFVTSSEFFKPLRIITIYFTSLHFTSLHFTTSHYISDPVLFSMLSCTKKFLCTVIPQKSTMRKLRLARIDNVYSRIRRFLIYNRYGLSHLHAKCFKPHVQYTVKVIPVIFPDVPGRVR